MDSEYTMPAVSGGDTGESEEERNRRLIRMAGGMSTMPDANVTDLTPRGRELALGATSQPNIPERRTEEAKAPDLGGMPAVASAPEVKTPSVDFARPLGDNATMPPAMVSAPAEMRANASTGGATPPGFFGGADEHPHANSGPGMPPAFYAGNSEAPRTPSVQPNAMPPVGAATKAYEDLQGQGRPELHGWKKALDVASQLSPIGRTIERNISGSPGHYDAELSRAALASAREQGIETHAGAQQRTAGEERRANAPQHVGQFTSDEGHETEVSRDPNSGGFATQDVGEVGGKEKSTDKKIDEYTNDQGKRVLTFERADGSHYDSIGGKVFQKPEQDANKLAGEIEAQVGAKPTTAVWRGQNYGTPEKALAAWGKEAENVKNREAAAGANARGAAYGANRPTNVIDTWNGNRPVVVSAKDAEENPGRYITQSGGATAIAGKVTLDDIEGALNNLKATTAVLDGGTVNRATLAAVLADPGTTTKNFMQSAAAGTLSPQEQDYVIDLLTAREVIAGLRKAGNLGTSTDSRIAAMLKTLPSAETPGSAYANKQIDSALGTLKRLRPGILGTEAQGKPSGGGGATGAPKVGAVEGGYRFKGGDPAKRENWEKQ